MYTPIYVAATGQHVGKTTSTLGLVANLKKQGYNVGYCKPVGQKYLEVEGKKADKDAVLFADMIGIELQPEYHSPVVLSRGVTTQFIEDPSQFSFREQILRAEKYMQEHHDLVVYEGTGHPGVGSVVDLSNAQVAEMLGAKVVMVVEGGVGRTLDKLAYSIALFEERKIPILGVIVNKVMPGKEDKIRHYVELKLTQMGLPLLGVLPYDKALSYPILLSVKHAVGGTVILNKGQLDNRVEEIVAGSLLESEDFLNHQNRLLVVSSLRLKEAIAKTRKLSEANDVIGSPFSGVIVTNDGRRTKEINFDEDTLAYLKEHQIPVLTTSLDTLGAVTKISRIEVKISRRTPWKVLRAVELISQCVDFKALVPQTV